MTDPARSTDVYTHGHHESVLRSHRWRTVENSAGYLVPELIPGRHVLDVGCGPGTITVDLARRVAPGQVIGIDRDAGVLELARAEAARTRAANAHFEDGDVYALPFADASFDIVHAHQVLQHLTDPIAALREMRRVCKPSGVVAVRETDYDTATVFPDDPMLTRWRNLTGDAVRANGAEPNAGRHILAWARAAGFAEITASGSAWCFASPEEREWWGGLWADRVVSSAFADQAVAHALTDREELQAIADAWKRWVQAPDGWFAILHGEVLCRG